MPREYHHIQDYEKEILELKSQGYTLRAIGEKFGFTHKQMHNFITRYNANQRKHENVNKDTEEFLFEEESFFDDNGIEHIVDEDLYCAEHDDFYEEF